MRIYTRRGDDGTTGLLFGSRAPKDSAVIEACGAVDEAQAAIGMARALALRPAGEGADDLGELDELLVGIERDLWVLMADLAAAPGQRHRLEDGSTAVTEAMVERLEPVIDSFSARSVPLTEFAVPGQSVPSAALDVARTVVRRAERRAVAAAAPGPHVVPYLNRLSDLLWTLARWLEGAPLPARAPTNEPIEELS